MADIDYSKLSRQQKLAVFLIVVGPDAAAKIFAASQDKLPAYVGAVNERGDYSIYKVLAVNTPANADKAKVDAASARLSEQVDAAEGFGDQQGLDVTGIDELRLGQAAENVVADAEFGKGFGKLWVFAFIAHY